MGTIWVREFTGGLDARRLPETTSGGSLIRGEDGHINRGGEFEKRAAFVPEYDLPEGTVGLAYDNASIYVFGSGPEPEGLPAGVSYQRLEHPDGDVDLVNVPSFDLYAGKIYAVAEFADGSRHHFCDGAVVQDWYDGRARATFRVTGGGVFPAVAASGSFEVTGGTLNAGTNEITDIKIDGVSIISSTDIDHTGNNATTAAAIANAINAFTSTPDYTAVADGQTVIVTAVTAGAAPNGKAIVVSTAGDVTIGNSQVMSGGVDSFTSRLDSLTVDGVDIIGAPVTWTTSNSDTAAAIASAINNHTSSPDYQATAVGDAVNVIAAEGGEDANGRVVAYTVSNNLELSPSSGLTLANGADGSYTPGTFVKTIGSRIHAVSGANEHGSGIAQPTKWTTDTTGAYLIDMSTQASGAEELTALATYQQWVAVFAARVILIWLFDADPNNNSKVQVLNNTGTASPLSVTQFGDNDLFYADESGIRSLRARDSSNAAATTDIGVPIDPLVKMKLKSLTDAQRARVVGLIEPSDGRFWLAAGDVIYVFSYFGGSKISAWSLYHPHYFENGERIDFEVENALVFRRRVYLRSGNKIFVYGGLETGDATDETEAVAWLPYLDGETPAQDKEWIGFDAAIRGLWEVSVGMDPTEKGLETEDLICRIAETTYNNPDIANVGESTHISLRFRSKGSGPAKLSSCAVHYKGPDDAA